ncbi:MAG: hypothetical protein RKE49_09820 [Oceanicaulis sp.]
MISEVITDILRAAGDKPAASASPSLGGGQPSASLDGATVLLVEDEALIGLDLQFILEEAGATVLGPIPTLSGAIRAASEEPLDAAILDIDLQGEDVFPAAEVLGERGVPFLFHTGHGRKAELAASFANAPVCSKPAAPSVLLNTLGDLIGRRRPHS